MILQPSSTELDEKSFDEIAGLAYRESGLTLVREKSTMVQSRLRHRLRALGIDDFAQYTSFVSSEQGTAERRQLISALTTNVSHFFRETHHFEELSALVKARLPELRAGGRMRIWSAGCSNGQEPLSAAITLLEEMPELELLDFRILATDIDANVIRFARDACYSEGALTGLTQAQRNRYFRQVPDDARYEVHPKLRAMIHYNELNLLGRWPMKHTFDAIFCRNVVIYFDKQTQEALWPRFHNALGHSGVLFLGHSERIGNPAEHSFACTGPTTYQKATSST